LGGGGNGGNSGGRHGRVKRGVRVWNIVLGFPRKRTQGGKKGRVLIRGVISSIFRGFWEVGERGARVQGLNNGGVASEKRIVKGGDLLSRCWEKT